MFEQSLLNALYLIPFLGSVAVAAVVPAGRSPEFYRRWALGLSSPPLIAALHLVYTFAQAGSAADAGGPYTVNFSWFRVQDLEVRYALFIDGLSLPLVLIAALLVPIGIAHSRVEERPREYYALCLLAEGAWIGTFLAGDFFLFSVFWTASLVPVSFLIGLQGGPEREYAAGRFFLYGLAGSVTMILAGIWLSTALPVGTLLLRSLPGQPFQPGMPEVVPAALARAPELRPLALAAWWGLFLAYAVRIPAWPLHTWLPEAQDAAPAGGSILLGGVLVNTGGYALFRILLPTLPEQSFQMRETLLVVGAIGILWAGLAALAQGDLRRLVACVTVHQMGFVVLGAAAVAAGLGSAAPYASPVAVRAAQTAAGGAVYQLAAHAVLGSGLLLAVEALQTRTGTGDISALGGLSGSIPVLAGYLRWFAAAAFGLPPLAGFIPLFLVFLGSLSVSPLFAAGAGVAALGWLACAAALLWTAGRLLLGPADARWEKLSDLTPAERRTLLLLAALSLLLGVAPGLLLTPLTPYLDSLAGLAAVLPPGR